MRIILCEQYHFRLKLGLAAHWCGNVGRLSDFQLLHIARWNKEWPRGCNRDELNLRTYYSDWSR